MRKALPITVILLLLTLSMTQFATAQQAQKNIITNQTTETLYVISSTKYGAEGAIPTGYRTSGWKTIAAGEEKTFWAYDPHKIYFQIFKGSEPIKPQRTTETFAFWIHRNANFNIVTQQAINADIIRGQLVYSSHNTGDLIHSDGFIVYNNGARITVTDAWVPVSQRAVPNTPVDIPDTTLRRAIENALNKPANTPITQGDMKALTSLEVIFQSITELTGLEYATNLKTLFLYNNTISDISPLQHLINLEMLALSNNTISDISPLQHLVNLEMLALSNNTISDISSLAKLVSLKKLYLYTNNISDVSSLAKLEHLEFLDLSGNPIADVTPLIGLKNSGTVIEGVSFPDPTVNIPDRNLRAAITEALGKNTGDTITESDILTLTSLSSFTRSIEDLTGLEFAKNLTFLGLGVNEISDISSLSGLANLTTLFLYDNNISDISPLSGLMQLSVLALDKNQISDISPLSSLTNLTELVLHENQISDISPLSGLTNLTELVLRENQISDISPLSGLTNLTELSLDGNRITDFSPIGGLLPNLVKYSNSNQPQQQTGIAPVAPDPPVVSDPQLNIYWAQSTDGSPTSIWRANLETNTVQAIVTNVNTSDLTIDTAGGKMYWINRTGTGGEATFKIQYANLDGSNLQDFFTSDGAIDHLTLDGAGGLYWINSDWAAGVDNSGIHKIQRANLDGSNVQDILTNIYPSEFKVDPAGKKIYWGDWEWVSTTINGRIRRANLDGTNIQDIHATRGFPRYITLDPTRGKIYWINDNGLSKQDEILCANLDGSDLEVKERLPDAVTRSSFLTVDTARNKFYWLEWREGWFKWYLNTRNLDNDSYYDPHTFPGNRSGGGRTHLTLNAADGTIYWTQYDPARQNFAIWQQPFGGEPHSIVTDVQYKIGALAVALIPPEAGDLLPTEPPQLEGIEPNYILHGFIGQENQIEGVAFSPDGQTLASIDFDGTLFHLNPHTLETKPHLTETVVRRLWDGGLREDHKRRRMRTSRSVAYSPETQWGAAGTSDKTILLWSSATQSFDMSQPPDFTLPAPGQVWAVAFSPDGQTLATGGGYVGIHLWDMRLDPPQIKATLTAKTSQVEGIAFHRDGRTLAVATGQVDEVVHLWDLQTETLKDTLRVPQVSVRNVAFSPDGRMLAGGAYTTGGDYGVGEGVLLWKQAPLPPHILANLTPHAVEPLSGPTVVGPGKRYAFTVHVKNARGVAIKNALVSMDVPNQQTHRQYSITDDQGKAEVNLQFPGVGKHDINVTVLERVSQQELKKTFPDRVEVPKPHAIAAAVPQPRQRTQGSPYTDAFTVTSADGRLLEGFNVHIRIRKLSYFAITDNKGIARITTGLPTLGTYNVNVAVLGAGPNSQEVLKKTFPDRVTVVPTCATMMPSNLEPLKPVKVARAYERTKISTGISDNRAALPKAIFESDEDRVNRTWTVHDTVADESGSLVLTVKFLNPTEADGFLRHHVLKRKYKYYQEDLDKYEGTFVDPPADMMTDIEEAAKEWSAGNIDWDFIAPGDSGDSDIRIAFVDEDQLSGTGWSTIGSPSDDDDVKDIYNASITMYLSTDVPYGTILHEFGHALGLTHEHLSPQFTERFEWDDTEPDGWADRYPDLKWDSIAPDDRIYKKIAFYYSNHYDAETITKGDAQADLMDNNFFRVLEAGVDEAYSEFDHTSIMTYELEPELLKTKPGASDDDRKLVDEEWAAEHGFDPPPGIGRRVKEKIGNIPLYEGYEELSDIDKRAIADLYGNPLPKVKVVGSVHVDGEEHDWNIPETNVSRIDEKETVSSTVLGDSKKYVRAYDPFIFKWGDEQRVEVYLYKQACHEP